jgi:lipoprotein-anchoring transpeptidase ErfK/SrfK
MNSIATTLIQAIRLITPMVIMILSSQSSLAEATNEKKSPPKSSPYTINQKLIDLKSEGTSPEITVYLNEQKLVLAIGGKPAVISPVSTGRKKGWTPTGNYTIIAKSPNHRSSSYGKHVNRSGKTVRSNVDSRKSKPASGTRFVGSPMPNFLRLTNNGIGIHAGKLPGYPASRGCVRVPMEVSKALFKACPLGTPVRILQSETVVAQIMN